MSGCLEKSAQPIGQRFRAHPAQHAAERAANRRANAGNDRADSRAHCATRRSAVFDAALLTRLCRCPALPAFFACASTLA